MKLLVLCLLYLVLGYGSPKSVLAADPLVFAHYMLWAPSSSNDINGFKSEISYAQSKGIDAFALNTNVWNNEFRQRADQIYQAAEELGSTFKIFFSLDMHKDGNGFLSAENVKEMLTRYANRSSQLRVNGKQFVSSWLGNEDDVFNGYSNALDGWRKAVFDATGGRDKYFFLPFFPTGGSQTEVSNMLNKFSSIVDGLYAWDTSAWPYFQGDFQNPSDSKDRAYLAACNSAGKSFMASISPWFFKKTGDCCASVCTNPQNQVDCSCQVKGNYKGPGLWLTRWSQLIANRPPFLEIVTWNDWVERSYVAPIRNPTWGPQDSNDIDFPHETFMELGSHYINWFKTGSEPSVNADSLYIFYYSHSKSASATADSCRVQHADSLDDKVYVVTMLTAPAQVMVGSGNSAKTFDIGQGINTVSVPMQEGKQMATLTRSGAQVVQVVGNKIVNNTISNYDFNVYSGFAK